MVVTESHTAARGGCLDRNVGGGGSDTAHADMADAVCQADARTGEWRCGEIPGEAVISGGEIRKLYFLLSVVRDFVPYSMYNMLPSLGTERRRGKGV